MTQMEDFTIDQFAGSAALILGSFASLLLVIWQSRCLCRCRIGLSDQCYIFDCSREPPPPTEETTDEETPPDINREEDIIPPNQNGQPEAVEEEGAVVAPAP